jgi:hypothetical protein
MPILGSTAGTVNISVNRNQLASAGWSYGSYIYMVDPSDISAASSGMIYTSSSNVDASNSIVTCKLIDENSFPFSYIRSGSYLKKVNGINVLCTGTTNSFFGRNGANISIINCITSDSNQSRHDIFNRNVAGDVSSSNPFNAVMPNSIISRINLGWVNADTRVDSSIGDHFFYTPLLIPITRRHLICMDANIQSVNSVKYVDSTGAQNILSVRQFRYLKEAFELARIALPNGISNNIANRIGIIQLSSNLPSYVQSTKFCSNSETYYKAKDLPVYVVTFTRKVAALSAFNPYEPTASFTENVPISYRLQGIKQSEDFLNFSNKQESGNAFFAWDGFKSVFLGISYDPIFYTGINVAGGLWDGKVIGFDSNGLIATNLANCQNILTCNLIGYQIGFESEKFLSVLTSNLAWSSPASGGGIVLESSLFEIDGSAISPQFVNPLGSRKKIAQKLR